jgi:pimeloyl-ACP methyl ester carboxylesterase
MPVTPFKIGIPEHKITRLKQKLAAADFPNELDNVGWDRGVPLADVKRLVKYWHDDFDWRQAEAELNQMPQYMTTVQIDGFDPVDLHFVHAKSPNPHAVPFLFCHGWPGSFDEASKILPLLLDGGSDQPSFDVVVPSLPNYGFSSRVGKPGFSCREMAMVLNKLMVDVLGYQEYVTQGGDLGYPVTRYLGYLYPGHCKASHYNVTIPNAPTDTEFPDLYKIDQATPRTENELEGLKRTEWFNKEGKGYMTEHMTKPQTIGYSLTDSPVGLLAWIYEKLHDWSDNYPYTDYEICKWVSIYWFSRPGPAATLHIYYESFRAQDPAAKNIHNCYLKDIKIGSSQFPRDLFVMPPLWNKTLGDLVLNKVHPSGGHFAAYEKPQELATDLREMFSKNGGAYAVVNSKTGYA